MLGNTWHVIAQPLAKIGNALADIAREQRTANQLKWLEIRSTEKGFAYSDGDLLIQVGRKVGVREQRG